MSSAARSPAAGPDPSAVGVDARSLFDAVLAQARRAAILSSVEALLGWDEQVLLPRAAGGYRGEQVAAIAEAVHALRVDPRHGERLETLAGRMEAEPGWSDDERSCVRLMLRDHRRHSRLPPRLVAEMAKACIDGQQAWVEARRNADWAILAPHLERIFALKREQAACQYPELDPYDALLDDYEPGARAAGISSLFDRLRPRVIDLVRGCVDSGDRPDDALLRRPYPRAAQERFVHAVAERLGFDFARGRIDTSEHPFCSTSGPHDCRLTTRWDESFLPTALFGVLHEAGHGLYEQGLPAESFGLPSGEAASLGIHESQSRLWENLVGRSLPFWRWCLPLARASFPGTLDDADAAAMQRALLAVRPSLIRVDADEVTYNLHVMLRFDLERRVILGDLAVADLPDAWDERSERDFGIRPRNATEGVLQDIHWSAGLIGYFPTYTLGNVYAAQLMAAAERDLPSLDSDMAEGRFESLLDWLRTRIHRRGRLLEPGALVASATGSPVSERWLVESLWRRYGPAHGLGERPIGP